MPLRSKWRLKFQNIYAERCGIEIATFIGSMIWSYIPNELEGEWISLKEDMQLYTQST